MKITRIAATLTAIVLGGAVSAAPLTWTDWTASDNSSAKGTLGGIDVTFTGDIDPAAQTNGGTNYWATNAQLYTPTGAENPPPDADIIRLTGGSSAGTQTLKFSSAVVNPLMAILSLGRTSVQTQYVFDSPFDVLRFGAGFWGNGTLTEDAGNTLSGNEGHGLIQFQGTFTEISWTVPTSEFWHGFQIGYVDEDQDTMAPVPVPAAGVLLLGALGAIGFAKRRRRA